MFELGGLKDQGETMDRKSRNKVPVGSLKKEVRDDIPINISEGEFVLPADVVRYHGLEKIMNMRQDAKSGLKLMDKMGQMGNSDQATLPDDIPFQPKNFQQGGINLQNPQIQNPQVMSEVQQTNQVPGVNVTPPGQMGMRPSIYSQTGQTPFVQPQPPQAPQVGMPQAPSYAPPAYRMPTGTAATPDFSKMIGAPFGQLQETETKRYVNPDTGEELYIPFVNGEPVYPIPAGYVAEEKAKEEEKKEEAGEVKTTSVRDEGGETSDVGVDTAGIKTTRVSQIASDTTGGKKGLTDFFSSSKGKTVLGSVLGNAIMGPIGGVIGGLLGRSLADDKQQLAQQMGAIPGTTAPIGPERDFDQLSQDAYGKSIAEVQAMLGGITPTFSYGYSPGSVDVATGGTYNAAGIAVDENGNMSTTTNGVPSYASFADFAKAMSVSAQTGYYGGPVSKDEYNNMSPKGKDLYNAYANGLGINSYETKDPDVEDISADVPTSPTDPRGMDFGVTDPSFDINADVEDISPDVETPSTTQSQPDPIDTTGDPYGGGEGSGVSTGDPSGGGGGSDIGDPSQGNAASMGLDDDVMGQSVGPGGSDTAGDSQGTGGPGCVIATHGLSTGGFTAMEKAKAELWCAKTYHGKWYGEAFRRGYRAAGMKHINAGTAPSVYQEFKDFVGYGRGVKKGFKLGLNYYLRTIQFFITGLFIKR